MSTPVTSHSQPVVLVSDTRPDTIHFHSVELEEYDENNDSHYAASNNIFRRVNGIQTCKNCVKEHPRTICGITLFVICVIAILLPLLLVSGKTCVLPLGYTQPFQPSPMANNKINSDDPFTVILFGDSLIANPFSGYDLGGRIQAFLPKYSVQLLNYGVGGNKISDMVSLSPLSHCFCRFAVDHLPPTIITCVVVSMSYHVVSRPISCTDSFVDSYFQHNTLSLSDSIHPLNTLHPQIMTNLYFLNILPQFHRLPSILAVMRTRPINAVMLLWDSDVSDVDEAGMSLQQITTLRDYYRSNITFVIESLRQQQPDLYISMSGPVLLGEGQGRFLSPVSPEKFSQKQSQLDAYVRINTEMASWLEIPYINLREAYYEVLPSYRLAYDSCLTIDGEHPNSNGAYVTAKNLALVLDGWLSAVYDNHLTPFHQG